MWKRILELYDFLYFLGDRFFKDRATQHAGSLTYTTLFAVVPILTVVFVMISAIPDFQGVEVSIQRYIVNNFMPAASEKVFEYINDFISQARNLTWIGVGFLIVTTFMMLVTIESAFNMIWRVSNPRRGLSRFLLYWALLSLGPLLIGASFAASTYIMSLNFFSNSQSNPIINHLLILAPFVAMTFGLTLFYAAIPNAKVPLKHAILSAIVAAALFECARAIFGFYARAFPSYQLIYGAFAAVPLFLLWIYISWIIILFGCELCCCLGIRHYVNKQRIPELVIVFFVLKMFHDAQIKGGTVSQMSLRAQGWFLPNDEWNKILDFLFSEKLVTEVAAQEEWVLSRDISTYPLQQLVVNSPWPLPRIDQIPDFLQGEWFDRLKSALVEVEHAEAGILRGDLAAWLSDSPSV